MIAYCVQPDATYAFVATRDRPMRIYRIDEKGAALRDRVQSFVDRVRARPAGAAYEAPLVAAGRALFDAVAADGVAADADAFGRPHRQQHAHRGSDVVRAKEHPGDDDRDERDRLAQPTLQGDRPPGAITDVSAQSAPQMIDHEVEAVQ